MTNPKVAECANRLELGTYLQIICRGENPNFAPRVESEEVGVPGNDQVGAAV
jgi:hypothetical protein